MRPVKILTRFTEDFARIWEPMWFENPDETRQTNSFRVAREYCKRPHHPPAVYLRLPDGMTPDDMIGKLVNIVITDGPNARGTERILKLRVFEATIATTPKYETVVVGWGAYGKCEPGYKEHTPVIGNIAQTIDSAGRVEVAGNFAIVHLSLRTYSSTGRAWSDLHVLFKKPDIDIPVWDYWRGMNQIVRDEIYHV